MCVIKTSTSFTALHYITCTWVERLYIILFFLPVCKLLSYTINTQTRAHVTSLITRRLHERTSNNSKIPGPLSLFRYTCVCFAKTDKSFICPNSLHTNEKEAITHIKSDYCALPHMNHTTKYNIKSAHEYLPVHIWNPLR